MFELVEEENGEVVGHILYSRLWADSVNLYAALAPLAVRPDRQRGGVGKRLDRRLDRQPRTPGCRRGHRAGSSRVLSEVRLQRAGRCPGEVALLRSPAFMALGKPRRRGARRNPAGRLPGRLRRRRRPLAGCRRVRAKLAPSAFWKAAMKTYLDAAIDRASASLMCWRRCRRSAGACRSSRHVPIRPPVGAPILPPPASIPARPSPTPPLLAQGPYDLAFIGSPNHLHRVPQPALDAGWPIFAEKPIVAVTQSETLLRPIDGRRRRSASLSPHRPRHALDVDCARP